MPPLFEHTTWPTWSRLLRATRTFDGDERGAAMTEFIILLPVFLLIFSGILKLTKLQSATVQAKLRTSARMWTEAVNVQREEPLNGGSLSDHKTAKDGADKADTIRGRRDRARLPYSDEMDARKFSGLSSNGTMGESNAALTRSANSGSPVADRADIERLHHDPSAPSTRDVESNLNPIIGNAETEYTSALVDDSKSSASLKSGPTSLSPYGSVTSQTGPTPAIGAGIRYGLVSDSHTETVQLKVTSVTFSVGYDTLVAPVPLSTEQDEYDTVGAARLTIEDDNGDRGRFKELLGIEYQNDL